MNTPKKWMCMAAFYILFLSIAFTCSSATINANAKSKTLYYASAMTGNKSGIKKMKLSSSKLTIWGKTGKDSSENKAYKSYSDSIYKGKRLKYKKTTLKLSKKVKIYGTGGTGPAVRYSKSEFKKYFIKQPDIGLGLAIKTKNGKVVWIKVQS